MAGVGLVSTTIEDPSTFELGLPISGDALSWRIG
jgi:hypothetical protein